ncbi:MAG: prepilin-type N-terminal cleavage/methylation domain-containing protein [Verrucomicrobiota bacterium]
MKILAKHISQMKRLTKRGFTLIEILVATGIMVILIGMVIQITADVLDVWNEASGKLSANAEARIAMDLITSDLETAILRKNGQQWLRVEGSASVNGGPYDSNTVALKLFAPALDRPTVNDAGEAASGNICAIAYRLEYKEAYADADIDVYALYRAIEDPKTTFDDLFGSLSDNQSPQLTLTQGFWDDDSITEEENFLASNVVDFKVFIYEETGEPNPTPVNANQTTLELTGDDYAFGGINGSTRNLLYADVIMTILSDEGMEILNNIEDGLATGYTGSKAEAAEQVVKEKGQTFSRRIYFLGNPI